MALFKVVCLLQIEKEEEEEARERGDLGWVHITGFNYAAAL